MATTETRHTEASQNGLLTENQRAGKRTTRPSSGRRALRIAGGLAILAMGALHLQQYLGAEYSAIPTIGTLFVLNFAGSVVVGLGLLAPIERLPGGSALSAATCSRLAASRWRQRRSSSC